MIKAIYDKVIASIILNWETVFPKIRNKTKKSLLPPFLFNTVLETTAIEIWKEEKIKRVHTGKCRHYGNQYEDFSKNKNIT